MMKRLAQVRTWRFLGVAYPRPFDVLETSYGFATVLHRYCMQQMKIPLHDIKDHALINKCLLASPHLTSFCSLEEYCS